MNYRFKFRCGITIVHYDDDGNDIETLLLINNISIFDDGDVGFNRESLKESVKEAVKRENLSDEEERTLWDSLDEYELIEDWFVLDPDFIEQCTGLRDKNGKLIYEGDIVKFKNDISEVKWCINGFAIDDGVQYLVDDMDIEIIGNIHENRELLK